jgi:hypothetical protein
MFSGLMSTIVNASASLSKCHKLILKSSALMYVSQSEFTDRLLMWYACAFPNCFRHFALNTFSAAQTLGILKAPVNEYALTLSPVSPNPLMGAWCVLLLGVFGPRIPPPNPPGFEPPPPSPPPRFACSESKLKSETHCSCFSKTFHSFMVLSFVDIKNREELAPW